MITCRSGYDDLVRRLRREYLEMPGLSLTLPQARRLLGAENEMCEGALLALIDAGLLSRRGDGYIRTHRGELPMRIAMHLRTPPYDCRWAEPTVAAAAPSWLEALCRRWTCLRDGGRQTLDVRDCLACSRWEPRLSEGAAEPRGRFEGDGGT